MQVQESLHQIQGDLNQTEIEHSNDITQVQESLHHIQSDLNQTEIEHSNDMTQLESRIIKVPGTCKELAAMNPSLTTPLRMTMVVCYQCTVAYRRRVVAMVPVDGHEWPTAI